MEPVGVVLLVARLHSCFAMLTKELRAVPLQAADVRSVGGRTSAQCHQDDKGLGSTRLTMVANILDAAS